MPCLQHLLTGVFLFIQLTAPGHHASAAQDPELQRILKAHVDAMGGWRAINAVQSLSISGIIYRHNTITEYFIVKKRPNKIRMTLTLCKKINRDEVIQVIRSSDGKTGWSAARIAGEPTLRKVPLTKEENELLLADACVEPVLVRFIRNGYKIELEAYEAHPAGKGIHLLVHKDDEDDRTSWRFVLDPSSYRVVYYEKFQDDKLTTKTTICEYEKVADVYYPKELIIDSSTTGLSRMLAERIASGIGIYEDYFEND